MPERQDKRTTHPLHQSKDPDSERTSRFRDNKRRHRARKKEYVQDLETKLAEYREQGVQATKEVQVAAQRIIRENAKLRELLRRTGYSAEAIDNWINQDGPGEHVLGIARRNEEMASSSTESLQSPSGERMPSHNYTGCTSVHKDDYRSTFTFASVPTEFSIQAGISKPLQNRALSTTEPSMLQISSTCSVKDYGSVPTSVSTKPPCKLLSLLAENPAVDITQIPLPPDSDKRVCDGNNGVECARAYKMMMPFATNEKEDDIARTLEENCTPMKGGGCKVKSDVLFSMLDRVIA